MRQGFLKVAAATPKIKVADPEYNAAAILAQMQEATEQGAKIVAFPELCLTGYTCNDLFYQDLLLKKCEKELCKLRDATEDMDALIFVGLPMEKEGKLYNVAAVLHRGEVLAMIPKMHIPNYSEYYETRHFAAGNQIAEVFEFDGEEIPFGTKILFENGSSLAGLVVGAEICEDLWTPDPPSTQHALAGANVIVNLSASDEVVGKDTYRRNLLLATSARLLSAYVYASAGEGESTQDIVFGGHNMIVENGSVLSEAKRFTTGITYADVDISRLRAERRHMNTYVTKNQDYIRVPFELLETTTTLTRTFPTTPFVPSDERMRSERCEEILSIQSMGLKKRLEHTGCSCAVIGISGGLDSTLAFLVTVRAFDLLAIPRENIICVTMPCFGTTDRTYDNACKLTQTVGATLIEVDIREAVRVHFRDIGHDEAIHDVTYENGQARERTQILMDMANKKGGMVIGTGDMSELALGWATYNGDHMSMYGVNVGVPKTLVRHLVQFYADTCKNEVLRVVLLDVLDTPVSPELLPPEQGVISQKTEDLVGPYELHDFFLYYMLRFGFEPEKIYRIAKQSFNGIYDSGVILKWLKTFYRRFFTQQFKRSCLPDGPKVGTVAVSPRGDLRMPSDASMQLWMQQLDSLY